MSAAQTPVGEGFRSTPLDGAVARLLEVAGDAFPCGSQGDGVRLRRSSTPAGDLVLDVRPRLRSGQDASDLSHRLAQRLLRIPAVCRAVAIPPRVHLTFDPRWMADEVTSAVVGSPMSYGAGSEGAGRDVVVSFSNPNANKPLHAGHLRDNFLGMAVWRLIRASGCTAARSSTISDWGVHICHAAIAYDLWGAGATPESLAMKPDWLVGDLLAQFHRKNAEQIDAQKSEFRWGPTPLAIAAADLLKRAAAGDHRARASIERVSSWAVTGIEVTERRIGTELDLLFRESEAISTSERYVREAVEKDLCARRFDGSVFMDLGGDEPRPVTLYRRDGTPTVHAQLIGVQVALNRRREWQKVIVLFGREWERGFETNCAIYRRLGFPWADRYEGVPHGMVTLSGAKMASRRGSAIRADDILAGLVAYFGRGRPPVEGLEFDATPEGCELLATGLLKYFLLRPKRLNDIDYDDEVLRGRALLRFSRILRALAVADEVPHSVASARQLPRSSPMRNLMLEVNEVPRTWQKALEHRDPSYVLRLVDQIADLFLRLRRDDVDTRTAAAVAVSLRRCLEMCGISLPAGTVRAVDDRGRPRARAGSERRQAAVP